MSQRRLLVHQNVSRVCQLMETRCLMTNSVNFLVGCNHVDVLMLKVRMLLLGQVGVGVIQTRRVAANQAGVVQG